MNTAIKTDTWEEIVDIGIELAQATDRNRWAMGELAVRAERKYGDGCIGKLAYAINVRTKTLYDYHRVSAFYGQYSAHAENLSWSHYREALRIGDLDRALWALEKASSRDWRVEKFSAILSRYLGKNKPERTDSGQASDNAPLNTNYILGLREWANGVIADQVITTTHLAAKVVLELLDHIELSQHRGR